MVTFQHTSSVLLFHLFISISAMQCNVVPCYAMLCHLHDTIHSLNYELPHIVIHHQFTTDRWVILLVGPLSHHPVTVCCVKRHSPGKANHLMADDFEFGFFKDAHKMIGINLIVMNIGSGGCSLDTLDSTRLAEQIEWMLKANIDQNMTWCAHWTNLMA